MTISRRKLLIGIISAIIVFGLHLLGAFYKKAMINGEPYDLTKNLIYIVAFQYFNISILFLLKDILVDYYKQTFLKINLIWIIRLTVTIAVLTVLMVIGFGKYLAWILAILSLIVTIFYIRFFKNIIKIENSTIPTIEFLKYFVIAVVLVFIIAVSIELTMKLNDKVNLKYLSQIVFSIPYILLSLFFYKTMRVLYEKNAST